ncbi:MAG: radical SAM protein, partial [Candidatus Bipolaricaulia bacterium]
CDQACAGCFYSARPGSQVVPDDAPFQLFEKVVREAERVRVFQIALGGGEPLLHSRIVDMVRLARQHRLVPNLTTNGNLLTLDLALALKEAGLGQVQISLNGTTEETNATTRPNFGGAMAAIRACLEANLRFGINFLITRSNVAELEEVIHLGHRLGAASVNLLRPKPPTTEGDWLERESLDAEGYRVVQEVLRKLQSKAQNRVESSETSEVCGDLRGLSPECKTTLDASLTFLLTDRPPQRLYAAGVWGCCAARKFVTVLQDGSVLPCSHVRWSDVGQGDFMRAWWSSRVFRRFRRLEQDMRGQCRACSYLDLCRGCPAVVMAFGGSFADSDPHCPKRDAGCGIRDAGCGMRDTGYGIRDARYGELLGRVPD